MVPTLESSRASMSTLTGARLAGICDSWYANCRVIPRRWPNQNVKRTTHNQGHDDGRKTDPDANQKPGTVRRGESGGPDFFAPAVRRPGRRLCALAAGGAVAGGLLLHDRWGMEGVKPPPPVRLKDYSVKLAVGKPSMVIVRSRPVLPEDHPSKDDELKAREEQAFTMVKAALDSMGGVSHFIQKGDVVVIKPNVAFDKNPDLAATTQPDTVIGRDAALLRGRRSQGDRGR